MKEYGSFKDQLNEAREKAVVFTFGRFQPPTSGHEKLVEKVASEARKRGADAMVYVSPSEGAKKNPIPFRSKKKIMKDLFGRSVKVEGDKKLYNPFFVAKDLSNRGYKKVYLVVGSDRAKELEDKMRKYVGHQDPNKSFDFTEFEVISAGERDPDAEGVRGMSGTKMRQAAADGNFSAFKSGLPSTSNNKIAKAVYDEVRKGMGIHEDHKIFDLFPLSFLTENAELITEQKKVKPTLLVLTTKPSASEGDYPKTVEKMIEVATGLGYNLYPVSVEHAFIPDGGVSDDRIEIHDYYNNDKILKVSPKNTIVFTRGSSMTSNGGVGLVKIMEISGAKMINSAESMDLCRNKYLTSIILKQHNIPTPRTTLMNDESNLDASMKAIGGEFPVVVKTITGAEGIGVSKVDSYESLKSVLQSLWKHEAELVLQEYMDIDFDVRTIVFNGTIIGSLKRMKGKDGKDFRTNVSLGNTSRPYKLSDKETRIILDAAAASGCVLSGVDHILTKDGIKVLEVNGSPGFNAPSYMMYPGVDKGDGRDILKRIISLAVEGEELVKDNDVDEVGYIENAELEGIGKIKAKVDSGNEGHSVLHATDIDVVDGEVSFKTVGGKKIKSELKSYIKINVGSGNIEKRPTVEIETKFAGEDLGKVRYSLSDRSRNSTPLLIGRKLVSGLGIKIDPSDSYINEEDLDTTFAQFLSEET